MREVKLEKGKYVSNSTVKDILENVKELLESQENGKERATEYLETLLRDMDVDIKDCGGIKLPPLPPLD